VSATAAHVTPATAAVMLNENVVTSRFEDRIRILRTNYAMREPH